MVDSIREWKRWPEVRPYFFVTAYARDNGRRRVDVRKVPDAGLMHELRGLQVTCPRCEQLHHPVRERADGSFYYAAGCPLDVCVGCSRSRAVSQEFAAVAAEVLEVQNRVTGNVERLHSPEAMEEEE